MRIAVIGDLQYAKGEEPLILRRLAQLADHRPDLAIAMGDYGRSDTLHTAQGFFDCAALLRDSGMKVMPLLGNHDVEFERGQRAAHEPMRWYREAFDRESADAVYVSDGVRCLCLSMAMQPEAGFVTRHSLTLQPRQYDWAERVLAGDAGLSTLLFVHAPTAGNGLRQTPFVHSAATDAYVEQNHHPERMHALLRAHPCIVGCISAHFHMGHGYQSAISFSKGLCHISCGVLTSASRDGAHHSRLIDVSGDGMEVYTVDHDRGGLLTRDLAYRGPLKDLAQAAASVTGRFTRHPKNRCLIGDDRPTRCFRRAERIYIATRRGYLWEYDEMDQALSGAICRSGGARALYTAEERLYCAPEDGAPFSVAVKDPLRFDRLDGAVPQRKGAEPPRGEALPAVSFTAVEDDAGTWVQW